MITVYLPGDSAAVALGADRVCRALEREVAARGIEVTIVRTGSRGAVWLEPLLEVETASGRVGYGPVTVADVAGLVEAGLGGAHPLGIGRPEAHPWFAGQTRLTFERCGIVDPASVESYRALGGVCRSGESDRTGRDGDGRSGEAVGVAGARGGAGFPTGIKWNTVRLAAGDRKYVVCNADEGIAGRSRTGC